MKRTAITLLGVMAVTLTVNVASAQREPGQRREPGQQRERRQARGRDQEGRQQEGRRGRPTTHPLIAMLDADGNGELSMKEIENAVVVLKKLDRNSDGKLTAQELPRPQFARGGPGSGRGRGDLVARIMASDKNKDGKITKEELPEEQQRIFQFADANKDGVLDKAELERIAARFRRGPGSSRGGRGGRNSDRPQRPQRPGTDSDS